MLGGKDNFWHPSGAEHRPCGSRPLAPPAWTMPITPLGWRHTAPSPPRRYHMARPLDAVAVTIRQQGLRCWNDMTSTVGCGWGMGAACYHPARYHHARGYPARYHHARYHITITMRGLTFNAGMISYHYHNGRTSPCCWSAIISQP